MRTAVAHELPEGANLLGWVDPIKVAMGGAVGAFGLWAAQRTLGKAAFQQAINAGFSALVDQIQEERDALRAELEAHRTNAQAREAQLSGEILNLTQTIRSLEGALRREGIPIPASPYHPDGGMIEIEGRKPE